jgi:hypothetical protein
MRSSLVRTLLALAPLTAFGCSSTYHPEYHPVTVTHFSQNISGGTATPVYIAPPPSVVVVPAAPAVEGPPPEFFR